MSASPEPLLEIAGLHAGYGAVPVLHDIDITVLAGELVAIIGSNGAGKTTLIRTVSGLIRPTSGQIRSGGTLLNGLDTADIVALGIAQAPEGRRLFGGLTVEENLRLGTFARADKRADAIGADLDAIFGYFPRLRERRRQLAGTLSGGEQQMCAIGRALMSRPRLLMIDELSLGLAPIIVETILDIIQRIHADGTSIILVEQDASLALAFSDRAIVLETGRVAFAGESQTLLGDERVMKSYLGA